MAERSLRMQPPDAAALVAELRANPPAEVGGHAVTTTSWFDEAGLLRLQLGDAVRLQIRPSGTEPKVKLYAEGIDTDPNDALDALVAVVSPD